MNKSCRKRGRPPGKERMPLTAGERRARNAQYERERRENMAEALADLAAAAGCSENVSNKNLLMAVSAIIQRSIKKKQRTVDELADQNMKIKDEIIQLELELSLTEL